MRLAISAGLILGLVWLLRYLSDVLIPFAAALLLAYLINPLVLKIQKRVHRRGWAVFISLVIVGLGLLLAVWVIVPMITSEIRHMGRILSDLLGNSDLAAQAARQLPPDLWQVIKDFMARPEVRELFSADSFWKLAETLGRKVLPGVWSLIAGTTNVIIGLIGLAVIGLYLVFLLMDYQKVREGWQDLVPPGPRQAIVDFVREFDLAMNRYFRAQAVVAAMVGLLFALGFSLIGLPLGILLGLLVGLLNMVPYLQLLALPPAFLLALFHALETGSNIWLILGLTALVFMVVQLIQDGLLVPKIMGEVTGLSPAMILLSLSVWGKILGMFGLLIALPMTCLLLAYYRRLIATGDPPVPDGPE
ncbi:MAG: AI-2E family transporter [Proteobacteria bacterium]|nr:AI-2E family transporter [Pseudomonadota bacterium]